MGKVYTEPQDASSQRGLNTMNVGKIFAGLPIAFFWLFFAIFAVLLTNIIPSQNNLTSFLIVILLALFFVLVLTGTIMLLRHLKNQTGFWTSKNSITSRNHIGKEQEQFNKFR